MTIEQMLKNLQKMSVPTASVSEQIIVMKRQKKHI